MEIFKNQTRLEHQTNHRERFIIIDEKDGLFFRNYFDSNLHCCHHKSLIYHSNHYEIDNNIMKHQNLSQIDCKNESIVSRKNPKSNQTNFESNQIDRLIKSRKIWPCGITTRAAMRQTNLRIKEGKNLIEDQKSKILCEKSSGEEEKSSKISETTLIEKSFKQSTESIGSKRIQSISTKQFVELYQTKDWNQFGTDSKQNLKQKNRKNYHSRQQFCLKQISMNTIRMEPIKILVFGSVKERNDLNFLLESRDSFLIEIVPSSFIDRNDLHSIFRIKFEISEYQSILLELFFIKWPDSFVSKSELYQETFNDYFKMTNLAMAFYDRYDLESIEYVQSWLKAFHSFHSRSIPNASSVLLGLDDRRPRSFWLKRINSKGIAYDHVISSLLNRFNKDMDHLMIEYRFFKRKPSLKPLWSLLYQIALTKQFTSNPFTSSSMADDNISMLSKTNVKENYYLIETSPSISNHHHHHHSHHHRFDSFGKTLARFLTELKQKLLLKIKTTRWL
ncbi:hypothetical protein SSS_02002 [Sarcoptes scabiei]|uniref:Uncharacterized protein n=1 Tax=Sarcoptes scabiei TaxID=52283 RepID=A0A834R7C7_SARSC|nr:hypothetical protein SSS_02002 [Sarcoptes scabiei]UXI20782.1 hypothetical protein NH340_JMT06725 [Sarcoptes scabiei]